MLPSELTEHWNCVTEQLTEHGARHDFDWPVLWLTLTEQQQHQAQRVLCLSDFVADSIIKEPLYFIHVIQTGAINKPLTRARISQWLDQLGSECNNEDDWHKALRIVRRRAQVQIIWRDLLRLASTLQTTRTLSDLADVCVCRSIEFLTPLLTARYGQPLGKTSKAEQQLHVLGMGKLGAYELNLSSDIDLIFAYGESGDTTGPKVISNQEFFIKLGQKLILALDKTTIDGFVFRTDMRLRPYGDSGPLVMNFASLEDYYQNQGRDWERYAMVKARIMTGEKSEQALELLAILRPFTYRAYIDYSAFESLRSMKAMINGEVRRRGLQMNVKLGPGGIREVEFIVQAFQLIRGGQDQSLQQRELVKILDILAADGYLPAPACEELKRAYLFLRDSEHAIQALKDEQTQQLPEDDFNRARIAWAMGYPLWEDFFAALEIHRQRVSYHFAQIVAAEEDDETPEQDQHLWLDLWAGELSDANWQAFISAHPNEHGDGIRARLDTLRASRAIATMQPIGRERLDALMPLLLQQLWGEHAGKNSRETLERIIPLLEAVLRRSAYLVLLKENPQALIQLVKLCGASSWVAQYISQTPLLLDELLVPETLYRLPAKEELAEELNLRLLRVEEDDLEQQMEQLRQFLRAHKLRAAACEVMEALPLMQISDYLTYLAEVIVNKVMWLSFQQMVDKYGYPTNADKEPVMAPEFAVIGYGKVGGLELSYSSDLDLVFLHSATANRYTTGDRSQDNGVFYTRMGQRMIHMMTTQTRSGDLYEVDMRLRPSGNSGMIVASMKAFDEYQHNHAWTWEHQALVRARAICGHDDTISQYQQIRQRILSQDREQTELAKDVREMRQKMRDHLGSQTDEQSTEKSFHLKQDKGGIVDIEFLVQYGVLAWAKGHPALLEFTDNMRLLDALAQCDLLAKDDAEKLQQIYLNYRAKSHKRALQNQKLLLDRDTQLELNIDQQRAEVIRLWQAWLEN